MRIFKKKFKKFIKKINKTLLIIAETATIVAVRARKNPKLLKEAKDLFIGDLQITTLLPLTETTEKKHGILLLKQILLKNPQKKKF